MRKIVLLILVSIFLISLASAVIIGNYNFEDYKVDNYNNVIIGAEKLQHCSWDFDDEYKQCKPEIFIWNRRGNSIDITMTESNFDLDITEQIQNIKFYYSTHFSFYNEERINNSGGQNVSYNATFIRFTQWKKFDNSVQSISPNAIVGIRIKFQLSKHKSASYNLTYIPTGWLLDPDISACGTLDVEGATYTLTQDVSSTGTCMIINNNSVTLDCQNHKITFNSDNTGAGNEHGIHAANTNYTTIQNCMLVEPDGGGYCNGCIAINLQDSVNYNWTVYNNTCRMSAGLAACMYSSHASKFSYNFNVTKFDGSNNAGIYAHCLSIDSFDSNFTDIKCISSEKTFYVGTRAIVRDFNFTPLNINGYGVAVTYNSTFSDGFISTGGYANIKVAGSDADSNQWNNFTNVSFDENNITFDAGVNSTLYRKWWVDVYVNNGYGNPENNAFVTANDKNAAQHFNETTDSNGNIETQGLPEKWINATTNDTYSNYTIHATKLGYNWSATEVNLTTNQDLVLTIKGTNVSYSENYTAVVMEGASTTFYLFLTLINYTIDSANAHLIYNGTNYSFDTSSISGQQANFSKTIAIPLITDSSLEKSRNFYWNYTINDENDVTGAQTQTTYRMVIVRSTSCNATYPTVFNFSYEDEATGNSVSNVINKWTFIFWNLDNQLLTRNYSSNATADYHLFCAYKVNSSLNFKTDTQFEYSKTNYTTRNYYLTNATVINSFENITLYLLNTSTTNLAIVLLKVVDEYDEKIQDAYITIMRYYVETGSYQTIEILKTDYYGQAIAKLVLYDVWYKFLIRYEGETIIETTPLKVVANEMTFKKGAGESVLQDWLYLDGVEYSLIYQNATTSFIFTFTDVRGLVEEGCMRVVKRTGIGDTEICSECVESSSATITCNTTDAEGTYVATAWFTINPSRAITLVIRIGERSLGQIFGEDGLVIGFLMIITLAAVGVWNPPVAIALAIVGLIGSLLLGFIMMSYAAIISIVIVGIFLIINMRH